MEIHRQRVKSAKPMISSRLERPGSDSPRKRTSKKTVLKQGIDLYFFISHLMTQNRKEGQNP